ncbi:MAG: type II secretion system protein GspJ [Betaproteobacteria bacterium]|nr:MAG: type II secretion system protein GspJ [Betaproteobacteria bacterium]
MRSAARAAARGFTLIELLTALLVLSLLALMSYRGLGAVLETREHVRQETDKWQRVAAFFARFKRDVELVSPRAVRFAGGTAPAWRGAAAATAEARLEFSRFAATEGVDTARRVGYGLNEKQEIELWLWPGLDVAPDALPARYPVLAGVTRFELQYLGPSLAWVDAWPTTASDPPIPRAVRLQLGLATGEEIVRIFALQS